ncbi:hypothetical protein R3P38DRAFT_2808790 [Favolaschia claudopus]|uniref:Uncharacterized protein n=1 Tax=Favolaschia claudopus TaxID=2862362 RepID=A0AAV9ZFP3_9AGAR
MDVKETVDQAIQQGNARVSNGNQADVGELAAHSCPLERKAITGHGVNGSMYSSVQANGQLNNTSRSTIAGNQPGLPKAYSSVQGTGQQYMKSLTLSNTFGVLYPPDHGSSSLACSFDFYKTTPHQANLYHRKGIRLSSYKEQRSFDRDYKAICLAGKSEGIEALKQGTDLNIAFERKSVVLIECIWVFSMSCTQGQALQDPHILARIRDVGFRLLESRGISRKTSYLPGNYDRNSVKRGLKTVELRATTPSVGRNSVRINYDGEKLTQITGIQCDTRNSSPVGDYNDSAEEYCWNQICPKWPTNHGSLTAKGLTGLVDLLYGLERKPLELERLNGLEGWTIIGPSYGNGELGTQFLAKGSPNERNSGQQRQRGRE